MDSDEDFYVEADSDESAGLSDEEELPMDDEHHDGGSNDRHDDEFSYEVLTADQIVQFMVDCIKEVNAVVQVCTNINFSYSSKFL